MKSFFKTLVCTVGLIAAFQAHADTSHKLSTENYDVVLTSKCDEAATKCNKVNYLGINKNTKKSIMLVGKYTAEAGYVFKNGKTIYRVSDEGLLTVKQGKKQLVEEEGQWQE